MERRKIVSITIAIMVVAALGLTIINIHNQPTLGDDVQKRIYGFVDPNSGTSVRAQGGYEYFYIQNRTNEGNVTKDLKESGGLDYYDPWINKEQDGEIGNIIDWMVGDPGIMVVNKDFGAYGTDHAGYVAYQTDILDGNGSQTFATVELMKIPTPTIGLFDSGFINIDWTPLADPSGLIAGYTVYRSTTNGTASGDADWSLVGGTVSAPISGTTFNDSSVSSGTDYYYSLKVVFTGYTDNNPGNVDNYECAFFGEGSEMVTPPAPVLPIDYIVIEYTNGTAVGTIPLNVGESTVSVIAQGWSNTGPTRVVALESDWTVDLTNLGDVSPINGTSTVFTANFEGGTAEITAEWGGMTDTFYVTIANPGIDYIVLENSTGGEIQDQILNMSLGGIEIFAAGYNNTGSTFIAYQDVTWEAFPNPGNGTFNQTTGTSTLFSGNKEGGVEIRGTLLSTGIFDNFTLNLIWGIPPTIDDIQITDDLGNVLNPFSLDILQTSQLYAWGFNLSSGDPISAVSVDWSHTPLEDGSRDNDTGLSSLFTAGITGGDVTITITSGMMTYDLVISINPPQIDYIKITDAANGTELTTVILGTKGSVTAYASGYNNTGDTYVGLVSVDWSKTDPDSLGTLSDATGETTTFQGADNGPGSVVIMADDGAGHTDDFSVDLFEFSLDEILITDAPDGNEVDSVTLDVGGTVTLYASGYNTTGGMFYVGLVEVDWSIVDALGTFSETTADTTVFTAGMDGGTSSITGTGSGKSDNLQLTVNAPTVDTIEIRDAVDNGGDAIASATFTLGNVTTLKVWCAGYNTTAGFIGDVSASWSLDVTTIGSIDITSGTFTTFTASAEGSGILTADVGGVTDSITITVNPEVDTTPPAIPTGLTVTPVTDQKSLTISWEANTDDAVSYDLYRSTTATGTFEKVNTAAITDTTYTDTGLEWETTYYYKITASDSVPNESPRSAAVSGTTAAEPDDGDGDGDGDDEFPIVLLLLPLIIIIVLILLFLMMRKKPAAEAPPEEKAEEPPAEEEPEPEPEEEELPEETETTEEEETPPPEEEGEEAPKEEGDEEKPPEE